MSSLHTFTVEQKGSKGWEIVAEGLSFEEAILHFAKIAVNDVMAVRVTAQKVG